MKLRDKQTGEIGRLKESNCDEYEYVVVIDGSPQIYRYYHTLKEIIDNYEDYEEPKGYWFIRDGGNVDYSPRETSAENRHKEIGNYFEAQEEAEKAVEKLKAWKRLKDNGFRFTPNWNAKTNVITIKAEYNWNSNNIEDLQLLFGDEGSCDD